MTIEIDKLVQEREPPFRHWRIGRLFDAGSGEEYVVLCLLTNPAIKRTVSRQGFGDDFTEAVWARK